ncbi:unnamed protein product [Miscanthus lutarioriparius]|uniref:CRAL-TRIO domain-containing protein n=1 Tax=Miscanthus lutarioriparius TaxID=422564 RepID=A0A811P5I0_9POAL|nr:unnamed protein product [Miscanthus lutarioriparius]
MASAAGGGAAGEGEWLKVAQLRAMEVDNLTLRRFLRARDHDVDKASPMFLKWRREAAPGGSVPEEQVRKELAQDKVCMGGVDRAGRPFLVAFPARHFSAGRDMAEFKSTYALVVTMLDSCSTHGSLLGPLLTFVTPNKPGVNLNRTCLSTVSCSCAGFVVYFFDKICARIPRGQEKFLCIVDLKGWGYSNWDIRAYIAAIEIMQNYYPERLGKALMIHVPYIFMKAWKMIYPFIDTNTRDKFVVVEDKSLQETLRREIDENQLPEFLGGKMDVIPLKDYGVQVQHPQAV